MKTKWRVLLLDTKKSNPNHYICLLIKDALEAHPLTEVVVKADYGDAINRARANNCNLFIAFDGEELERGICGRLASICGTSILWVTEDPYECNINKVNSDLFDLVFTNDSNSVDVYGQKGFHLPFASGLNLHFHEIRSEEDGDFLYDLLFVGTAWPNRVEFIKRLQPRLAGLKVKFALPYNQHIPAPNLEMAPSDYLWKTPNSEFAKFANRSRVTLTLHRDFSSSGDLTTAQTPGPRLFEVALSGGFQLIDMSLPEVAEYLKEDTEFAGFRTPEECIEKLQFYLDNPYKRISIARSAQERALRDHLYSHRINTIYLETSKLNKPARNYVRNQRPKVLFVTHNILGVQPYGGVEVFQHEIIKSLRKYFQFFIYTVDRTALPLGKKCAMYDEDMNFIETYTFDGDIDDTILSCQDRERMFSDVISRMKIDLVHFQHLMGHVPSLPYISKALGIPSVASLHDYYTICRNFNLIDYQGKYCAVSALPAVSCDICLNAKDNAVVGSQAVRRSFYGRALGQIDALHANTEGVAELFKAIFPNLRSSNQLQIYGVPMPLDSTPGPIEKYVRPIDPIQVAIVGNFTKNKGADVFIHAFNQMRSDNIQFHVFGTIAEPYNTIMQQLSLPNVEIHGEYQAGSIVERLKKMSLSLHLSVWPETYCITLSEVWQAGVVPIVSDIGALGERVVHEVNGFKVPMGEPGAVVDILRQLIAQPKRIEKAREQISLSLFASNEGSMAWLENLYSKLLSDFGTATQPASENLPEAKISLSDCGIMLIQNKWLKLNNAPQAHAVINNIVQGYNSPLSKLLWYRRNYGVKKTVQRVMQVIKTTIKKNVRRGEV